MDDGGVQEGPYDVRIRALKNQIATAKKYGAGDQRLVDRVDSELTRLEAEMAGQDDPSGEGERAMGLFELLMERSHWRWSTVKKMQKSSGTRLQDDSENLEQKLSEVKQCIDGFLEMKRRKLDECVESEWNGGDNDDHMGFGVFKSQPPSPRIPEELTDHIEEEDIRGVVSSFQQQVQEVEGCMGSTQNRKFVTNAVKNRKFKVLKKLVVVKVLKKRLKKLASDEDLKTVKSDFEEKLKNLESAGVRELNNLLSAQKYYIWWVLGSLVVLSLRDVEITPSGLLNSPLRLMVLLGAVILLAKFMNW